MLHIVGAIEVLDAGEPRPKLGLYVSCPNDLQPRGMLEIGKRLPSIAARSRGPSRRLVTTPV